MISEFGAMLDGLRAVGAAEVANVAGLFVALVTNWATISRCWPG